MPRLTRPAMIALCWLPIACAGASDGAPATTTTTTRSTATSASAAPTHEVRVSAPGCGYGGSATAVSIFIDVDSSIPLTHVTTSFTLADPSGANRGGALEPSQLVVSPIERGLLDFSTQGTAPFDGSIAAHVPTRLQYFAGASLDERSADGAALHVDVVVRSDQGTYTASCPLGQMWPSS